MSYQTEQESFWSGSFGDEYIDRNRSEHLLASNLNFFSKIFECKEPPSSVIEFGANIGMNLKALKLLFPSLEVHGVEINDKAALELEKSIGENQVTRESLLDYSPEKEFDLSFSKGVLIHINPDFLSCAYEKLYQSSKKYILVAEYYNPTPVEILYRGHKSKLFKRDFCREMMDIYGDLELVDYGFSYKKDPAFSQDDITWFLMRKQAK